MDQTATLPKYAPGNLIFRSDSTDTNLRLKFHHNEVLHALCGSGMALLGSFTVTDNFIAQNGRDWLSFLPNDPPGPTWSDGMTVLGCDNGYIGWNTFVDNTDIDLPLGGGPGCLVDNNTIGHFGKYAYMGLNVGNFLAGPTPGDHTGSTYQDNTIYTGTDGSGNPLVNLLSIGIAVGSHPFDSNVWVANTGDVVGNTAYNNVINMAVDGTCPKGNHIVVVTNAGVTQALCEVDAQYINNEAARLLLPPNGNVTGNILSSPFGTRGIGICELGFNSTVNPQHRGDITLQAVSDNLIYDDKQCQVPPP